MLFASAPYQPGLGWLTGGQVGALWFLILGIQTLMILRSLYLVFKAEKIHGEEKTLLIFGFSMVVLPISALVGIGCWFACDSLGLGFGAFLAAALYALMSLLNPRFP
ncbi:MAG: hypothetical protein K2X27_25605 [Candidatus Obscuribacterales bacterium]|nr:hypothetical protein [Candidatus Obscuribacterales bacterium]